MVVFDPMSAVNIMAGCFQKKSAVLIPYQIVLKV
jgi:hypothetical protein